MTAAASQGSVSTEADGQCPWEHQLAVDVYFPNVMEFGDMVLVVRSEMAHDGISAPCKRYQVAFSVSYEHTARRWLSTSHHVGPH